MTHVIWSWLTTALDWYTPDKVIALATIVYAIVTIVMFFAIQSQAKAAHRQADIAEIAATAAKQSADAIIKIERPWIVATLKRVRSEFIGPNEVIRFICAIKNYGKSPAWITSFGVKRHNVFGINDLTTEPDFSEQKQIEGEASLPPGEFIEQVVHILPNHLRDAESGKLFLFVYGFVYYRDVFGNTHETRFCFRYQGTTSPVTPGGFYVGGPASYNRQT